MNDDGNTSEDGIDYKGSIVVVVLSEWYSGESDVRCNIGGCPPRYRR